MSKDQTDQYKKSKSQRNIDWENRVLCSDGNCIGVIGPDGCCKECGKPYEGTLPWQIKSEQTEPGAEASPNDENQTLQEDSAEESLNHENEKVQNDIDWENRRLCSDGSCIGVIGPDGHCKECGKPYAGD